jgi:hypothetical protein
MSSSLDDYLKEVDRWKYRVHRKLKGLTPRQRAAFWAKVRKEAERLGLQVVESPERPTKKARRRRTG